MQIISSPVAWWGQLEQISAKTTSRRGKHTVNKYLGAKSVKSRVTMNNLNMSYFLHKLPEQTFSVESKELERYTTFFFF